MKYKILIEEVVSKLFVVDADSEQKALEAAIKNYKNCEFILDPGELEQKKVAVLGNDGEAREWVEL